MSIASGRRRGAGARPLRGLAGRLEEGRFVDLSILRLWAPAPRQVRRAPKIAMIGGTMGVAGLGEILT
jgi:hypothetical protein